MTSKQISLLTALLAAHVDCVVVGGVAVSFYGYVRTTNDLDIFIRPTEENAVAAFEALESLNIPLDGLVATDPLVDEENVRLGSSEDHIDILASIGEMPFDRVWRNRSEQVIGELRVPFIPRRT